MTFLHPLLLALLPLALIPLILHLITLRRMRTIELSTFRFLFDNYKRQKSRPKFAEALLTLLRTCFILFLVLAVSRPVARHWGALFGSSAGGEVVFLVDCSASMAARTDGVSALHRARAAALAIVDRLGPDRPVSLIRVAARPEVAFRKLRGDLAQVRDRIESLTASPSGADLRAAFREIFPPGAKRESVLTIYVVTDGQAAGWNQLRRQGLGAVLPDDTRVVLLDVGSSEPVPNLALLGDPPVDEALVVGLPVTLRPLVANYSGRVRDVVVKAVVEDQEVARAALQLKPGERTHVPLLYTPGKAGRLRARFEIPEDRFPDDDTFLFTLPVAPPVPVILVNGHPHEDPYQDEALYLRTALTSGTRLDEQGAPADADSQDYRDLVRSIDVREVGESELNEALIRDAGVVILANCGKLSDAQLDALRADVHQGGGVIVWPGDLVEPARYNEQWFGRATAVSPALTTARLAAPVGDPDQPASFERLGSLDVRHPALDVFDEKDRTFFRSARFYRWFPLTVRHGVAGQWVLARFSSGDPAVVHSRYGAGNILVAAFPVNTRWSNLPVKPEFVPLTLRMVNFAQRRPAVRAPAVASPAEVTEIHAPIAWAPVEGTVSDEGGWSTPVVFQRSEGKLVGAIEAGRPKGYYQVSIAGRDQEGGQAADFTLAVNLDADESDFVPIEDDAMAAVLPGVKVQRVDATSEAQQLYGTVGESREVWRGMIWLLFVIIGVEMMVATLSPPGTRAGEGSARREIRNPEHLQRGNERTSEPLEHAGIGS